MKYSREMMIERYNRGEELEFICFWGHTAEPGEIKKSCLSQWYPCEFEADHCIYHTSEQYMMAQKALLFSDTKTYDKIMAADNPKDYKALGRRVQNFDLLIWDKHKYQIVLTGNIAKFSQNKELEAFLIGTGNKILVEASPYDAIWGVQMRIEDPLIQNPNNWAGENLLGFALMETRSILSKRKKTEKSLL